MENNNPLFLDTSIMIARVIHSPEMKSRIAERAGKHSAVVTSLVVKQEFKRRFLKEASYLLKQLNAKRSYSKVRRHVLDVLTLRHYRKQKICLQTLETVFEHSDDADLTERLRRYLRTLLRFGLSDFAASVDYVLWDSGCACSYFPIVEKSQYVAYDFGPDRCSKAGENCGVVNFVREREAAIREILKYLQAIPESDKSSELKRSETFIETVLTNPAEARALDPCLTVGDLVIALESGNIPAVYTLNSRESQHLCRALHQDMVAQSPNYNKDEVVCLAADKEWPTF
jgi:hypothetical protein